MQDGTRIYCFPTVACSRGVEDLSPFYLTGGHESPAHLHCITGSIWCLVMCSGSTLLNMGQKSCLLHPICRLLVRHTHGSHAWKPLFTGGEALKMGLVRVPKDSTVNYLLMRTHGLGLLPEVSLSLSPWNSLDVFWRWIELCPEHDSPLPTVLIPGARLSRRLG